LNARLAQANDELARANAALQAEKARELEALNADLGIANAELAQTNQALKDEVAERIRAQEALEATDRRKDDFLAMLSHELRNPLAAIQGAIELMQRKPLDDPQLVWARDVVSRQNRHLSRLIDDLLDVSRITRGKLTLHKETVELREVARHAAETVRPLIQARRHDLTLRLTDHPLYVEGDSVRLAQVVSNLLTNAAKYTPEGGSIEVAVERSSNAGKYPDATIRVKDNGCGIRTDVLERLFEPSTHEERLNSGSHGGLGIGLIVVRGLVEMHGGVVEARSNGPMQGSEFVVRLPLVAPDELTLKVTPARDPGGVSEEAADAALRILVVDDNQDSASSMMLLLELQGHEVCVAHSGPAALALACERGPHVILLDIGMPGMNGYEVARRLRGEPAFAHTLLVAITGYGRTSDLEQTQAAGFDHHLVKPIDYDKLLALLASCSHAARACQRRGAGATVTP
jgi:signal transduction histidine kinase/ActR/RegA family two-component response regulator